MNGHGYPTRSGMRIVGEMLIDLIFLIIRSTMSPESKLFVPYNGGSFGEPELVSREC